MMEFVRVMRKRTISEITITAITILNEELEQQSSCTSTVAEILVLLCHHQLFINYFTAPCPLGTTRCEQYLTLPFSTSSNS